MTEQATPRALPTHPDQMICFAIYAASHAINRTYAPLLKPLGLTYPQYITLSFLWHQDGLTVGDLSNSLQMETSTLTPLLKRLEKLGHVQRKRGVSDERKVFVHLTESGRDLQKNAPEITACVIESTGMELHALDQLVTSLTRLNRHLLGKTEDANALGLD